MSKKLIAVAASAALALTGLVGVAPATAAMVTSGDSLQAAANSLLVTSTVSRTGAGTLADPYKIDVPEGGLATSATTLRFQISTTAARVMTVTANSGVRLVATVTNTTAVVLSGADSLTVTADANGAAEFRAYPTSTTRGVVTITNDGDITQIYVTGIAGDAYDLVSVTLPVFELSKAGVVTAVVTDAFGNAVEAGTLTTTLVGTGSPASTAIAYSGTTKRFEGTITPGAVAGQLAVGVVLTVTATTAQKAAFGDPNSSFFGLANIGVTPTVAQLTAQVAALTAQLANSRGKDVSVTKAKYNSLARKWNASNPSARVALKK